MEPSELGRIEHGNSRKSPEIGAIEGQDVHDRIDLHDGNQMSVMRELTGNQMLADKPFPCVCHSGFALQEAEKTPQFSHFGCNH